jgi:hypothetical protein
VRKLRFLDKLEAEIDEALESILEGAAAARPARHVKGSA